MIIIGITLVYFGLGVAVWNLIARTRACFRSSVTLGLIGFILIAVSLTF